MTYGAPVWAGDGDDLICTRALDGAEITSAVSAGAGADRVLGEGSAGMDVFLGDGSDVFTGDALTVHSDADDPAADAAPGYDGDGTGDLGYRTR